MNLLSHTVGDRFGTSAQTILVVGNDPDLGAAIELALSQAGYRVVQVRSVTGALQEMSRTLPDLIIADLWTPEEGGERLWEAPVFRSRMGSERIVLLTGRGSEEPVVLKARRLGLRVLPKPFDCDQLVEIVRRILTRPKPRILVVDDDPGIREVFDEFLRRCGYQPVLTKSGAEALELIRSTHIDAVVIDLHLPEMPGTILWEKIREVAPGLAGRAVFVTGTPEKVKAPCPVVAKPFDHGHLAEVLGGLLIPL
jgi:DNA-binding response OmpR family regulator